MSIGTEAFEHRHWGRYATGYMASGCLATPPRVLWKVFTAWNGYPLEFWQCAVLLHKGMFWAQILWGDEFFGGLKRRHVGVVGATNTPSVYSE